MRLVMMGTGSFAVPTFAAILECSHQVVGLVTQPDRRSVKERGSTRQARRGLKEIATERGLPVLQTDNINTPEGVRDLAAWKPDLLVVAAYGQILSRDVLAVPAGGGINVHASLLPKYRGAAPIAWAVYHGEKETGVTIIRMSVALDAGDILAQEATPIGAEETAGELETRLALIGSRLALTVIGEIAAGTSHGVPQDKTQATKAPKLTKEHGLIDWALPGETICRQIRAMQPWPTPYTFFHRPDAPPLRLIIFRAGIASDASLASPNACPGKIRAVPNHARLIVESGDGQVEILELQPAGKRRMKAGEFLRGHGLAKGGQLGGELS